MTVGQQNFQNHRRIVPAYHVLTFGCLVLNLGWQLYQVARQRSMDSVIGVVLGVGLVLLFFFTRLFALKVQDRVIRLEMRLRLAQVLPDRMRAQMASLSTSQLVALRFASDAELPGLCDLVFNGTLQHPTDIKKRIRDWQADDLRA